MNAMTQPSSNVPGMSTPTSGRSCDEAVTALCADAMDADVSVVRRMVLETLKQPGRHAEEALRRQLLALENVLLVLQSLALTDELTHLTNRRGFLLAGGRLLETLRREGDRCVVFYLDVDNLKYVNDTQGHAAGDALLLRVARVLKAVFRKLDIVGRLGGDEFAVLAPSNDSNACRIIQSRLNEAVAADNAAEAGTVLSLSVGWAQFGAGPNTTLPELLKLADATMYRKKLSKRFVRSTPMSGASRSAETPVRGWPFVPRKGAAGAGSSPGSGGLQVCPTPLFSEGQECV